MTCSNPWTIHEVALLIGYRSLGEDLDFISDALRKPKPEVIQMTRNVLSEALGNQDYVEPQKEAATAAPRKPSRSLPARKFRVVPYLSRITNQSRNVTAELMGDPSAAKARRAAFNPPEWKPETSNRKFTQETLK
jgi:hypothetical protein